MICQNCSESRVKLYIDAEYSHLQPAVRALTLALMKYSDYVIYNTYQCYLKDTMDHLEQDLQIAHELGFAAWGCKLVRGAYLQAETKNFADGKIPSLPLQPTFEDTNRSYNNAMSVLFKELAQRENLHLTVATHNIDSIKLGLTLLKSNGHFKEKVNFAQINGLADPISLALSKENVTVLKLIPCGSVEEVLPWLGR